MLNKIYRNFTNEYKISLINPLVDDDTLPTNNLYNTNSTITVIRSNIVFFNEIYNITRLPFKSNIINTTTV